MVRRKSYNSIPLLIGEKYAARGHCIAHDRYCESIGMIDYISDNSIAINSIKYGVDTHQFAYHSNFTLKKLDNNNASYKGLLQNSEGGD